jgi:hypothetical protein
MRAAGEVERHFEFLLGVFTPRTVFMEIGAPDCALALRAATYVERVWAVDVPLSVTLGARAPCNLRLVRGSLGAIPPQSVDVAFSEGVKDLAAIRRVLAPGGVYFLAQHGSLPRKLFRDAGFSRVAAFIGAIRIPTLLANLGRSTRLAAYT